MGAVFESQSEELSSIGICMTSGRIFSWHTPHSCRNVTKHKCPSLSVNTLLMQSILVLLLNKAHHKLTIGSSHSTEINSINCPVKNTPDRHSSAFYSFKLKSGTTAQPQTKATWATGQKPEDALILIQVSVDDSRDRRGLSRGKCAFKASIKKFFSPQSLTESQIGCPKSFCHLQLKRFWGFQNKTRQSSQQPCLISQLILP